MVRNRASGSSSRRTVDLTGIMTMAEKEDLVTLISRIMERMSRQVGESFDATPTCLDRAVEIVNEWVDVIINKDESPTQPGEERNPSKGNNDPAATILANSSEPGRVGDSQLVAVQNQLKPAANESSSRLNELKKELVEAFEKWQRAVLQRIRDIHITEPAQPGQAADNEGPGPGGRGRGFRGGRGGMRGGRGRGGPAVQTTAPLRPPPFNETDPELIQRFRPSPTPLWQLPLWNRKRLLHIVLLLLLSMEDYPSYARLLMLHLTSSLQLPLRTYQEDEVHVAKCLGKIAAEFDPGEAMKKFLEQKAARRGRGSGQVPLTASLPVTAKPSPTIMAEMGTPLGAAAGPGKTAAASLLGCMSTADVHVGNFFGIYLAKSSVKPIESYVKDVPDFGFVPLHGDDQNVINKTQDIPPGDRRLQLIFVLNGWLTEGSDVTKSWKCLGHQAEAYAVRWEVSALSSLGTALETAVGSAAWAKAHQELYSRSSMDVVQSGQWPSSILKINKIVDNAWNVGMVRADKAGLILADTIHRKVQGGRPINLLGHSLAARTIYVCLMALAERRQFGLVDSVVLFGAPAPSETHVWLTLKSAVAGRLVNVYSDKDYMLGFMMRMSNTEFGIAGLQPIVDVPGVENYDASNYVSGHLRYQYLIGTILRDIGWEDVDAKQVVEDQITLAEMDRKFGTATLLPAPLGRTELNAGNGDTANEAVDSGNTGSETASADGNPSRGDRGGRGGRGGRARGSSGRGQTHSHGGGGGGAGAGAGAGGSLSRGRRGDRRNGGQSRAGKNTIQP